MSTLEALQATLSAEHAALHLYGLYGGRTSQTADPSLFATLQDGYRAHRARRDQLRLAVADLGADPVAAGAAYDEPEGLRSARSVSRAALLTEQACAETYAALVAESAGPRRRWAATALTESALLQLRLGGRPAAFPGAPELG
ncbi:ferritin-like domain-containing protein [Nocardioides sp. Soil805]|uniref:ferritin-like domain-containing protein n=1 Tax=Nocardioides sp. Soil805 TaxID=1736416 RepID=UPI000A558B2E|nr:ferritin-like domain-containing protein [Nocardioides sp. Soil805]